MASRLVFDQTAGHGSLTKLTHKMSHLRHLLDCDLGLSDDIYVIEVLGGSNKFCTPEHLAQCLAHGKCGQVWAGPLGVV